MVACPSCGSQTLHDGPCPTAPPAVMLQGRYELLHVLGQGGMGTVFMARDMRLNGRDCVVKKLRDDFYREEDRQKAQAFFEREAGVLARLQNPNIVHINDYFREGNDYYLVMEHVKGRDLNYILTQERGEPFDEDGQVIPWAMQICDVLTYLHSENVIYRDLKPSNVMIDVKGQVKLVDFGIARPWEETGENTHVVSAGYSPPEQYWGAASPQSDIYALGATMHFLLTGKDPEALHASSPRSLNATVSEYTDGLVQKATAQDLNQRFQTAQEFREALLQKDFVSAPETPRSRVGEIAVGLVLFVGAILLYIGPQFLEPMLPKTPQLPMDRSTAVERPEINNHSTTTTGNAPSAPVNRAPDAPPALATVNHADLAAQVMDEKDLTDPDGIEPEQSPSPAFGFKLPWQKSLK